jgi:hypothetical protein
MIMHMILHMVEHHGGPAIPRQQGNLAIGHKANSISARLGSSLLPTQAHRPCLLSLLSLLALASSLYSSLPLLLEEGTCVLCTRALPAMVVLLEAHGDAGEDDGYGCGRGGRCTVRVAVAEAMRRWRVRACPWHGI